MEYLLFGDGVNSNTKLIADLSTKEREYLIALAEVFRDYTTQLDDAWQVSHNPQDANAKPYAELLKTADPFGESLTTADTSKVESQYSWNSLTDFSNNIIGVRNVYQGEFTGGADKQGLIDFVTAADATLATRVASEIDDAILKIQAISGSTSMPFRQAILDADGRARTQVAVDALTKLQTTLQSDVLPLLSDWNS